MDVISILVAAGVISQGQRRTTLTPITWRMLRIKRILVSNGMFIRVNTEGFWAKTYLK